MTQYKFLFEEIKQLFKSAVILVDSREKKNEHILDYFRKQGISWQQTKLDYGDYSFMIPKVAAGQDIFFHRDIVVERKASLEESSGNLTQDRDRFEKEFLRARNDGAKIYLMIESPGGYSDIIAHKYQTELSLLLIWLPSRHGSTVSKPMCSLLIHNTADILSSAHFHILPGRR